MPRWYWWIAGVFAVRATWNEVHPAAAVVLAATLLLGFWTYRVVLAANEIPDHRAHAARREVRRIASELGDVALGWALIILFLLGIAVVVATRPPDWRLVGLVCGAGLLAIVVLLGSWRGLSSVVDQARTRRWEERRTALAPVSRAWNKYALSADPTDRALVERVIREIYERRRSGSPAVEWASSPAEFRRLVSEASKRDVLGRAPPWWASFLPYERPRGVWSRIWDAAGWDSPEVELEAALEASIGAGGLEDLVANTAWFSFREGRAIALEHPIKIRLDANGDLHDETGPAARFADGWSLWALRGVVVPAEAVEDPDGFDPAAALRHENLEVRRVLLEHLGWDRVVRGAGLTPHAEDEHGRLWLLPVPDADPVLLLEVENATPDADGSHRRYFLRVPPTVHSPREATAWTFGLSELEYAPDAAS